MTTDSNAGRPGSVHPTARGPPEVTAVGRSASSHGDGAPPDSLSLGLRDLALQPEYRTGVNDLLEEFYVPCLAASVRYDRSVGYFDTKAFARAAEGLAAFIANGGRVRLVVSPPAPVARCRGADGGPPLVR